MIEVEQQISALRLLRQIKMYSSIRICKTFLGIRSKHVNMAGMSVLLFNVSWSTSSTDKICISKKFMLQQIRGKTSPNMYLLGFSYWLCIYVLKMNTEIELVICEDVYVHLGKLVMRLFTVKGILSKLRMSNSDVYFICLQR